MAKQVSLLQLAAILEATPDKVERRTINGMRKGAMRLMVLVEHAIRTHKPFPIVDRARMVQSVLLIPTPKGAIVRVDAPYAPMMEHGTRPFMPPLEPIVAWATRKGFSDPEGIARAIRWKFYREGIKPKRFFARAVADFKASGTLSAEVIKALNPVNGTGGGGTP
jgi:hypothetical protein